MRDIRDRVAALLEQAAQQIILPRFGNLHDNDVTTKTGPTDLVTVADREAELWLSAHLRQIIDCPVIGEETCAENAALRDRAGDTIVWTLDPIDGTSNFVKGRERFCTMVALVEEGIARHCWIYHPLAQTLYYAESGRGSFAVTNKTTQRLRAQPTTDKISDMIGSGNTLGVAEPQRASIQRRFKMLSGRRFPGSAGIQGVLIASGNEDYMIHGNCTPWDHAPVDLICREAGAYSGMIDSGAAFRANAKGPFMVAANENVWRKLADQIWRGENGG